jgi:tetratricopeptide (TPR) repeat protein
MRRGGSIVLATLLLAFTTTGGLVQEGNRALEKGDPEAALAAYAQALERAPGAPEILFDTGLAKAAAGDPAAAREAFLAALAGGGEGLRGAIEYNVGNTYFAEENYAEAAKAYRAALAADPGDPDAKANLELSLRRITEQKEKRQEQDQQPQGQQNQPPQKPDQEESHHQDQPPQADQQQGDSQQPETDQGAGEPHPEPPPQTTDQTEDPEQAHDQRPGKEHHDGDPQRDEPSQASEPREAETAGGGQEVTAERQMDPQQVDQLLDALQSQEEQLQQQVRARLVPVAPRTLEQDW